MPLNILKKPLWFLLLFALLSVSFYSSNAQYQPRIQTLKAEALPISSLKEINVPKSEGSQVNMGDVSIHRHPMMKDYILQMRKSTYYGRWQSSLDKIRSLSNDVIKLNGFKEGLFSLTCIEKGPKDHYRDYELEGDNNFLELNEELIDNEPNPRLYFTAYNGDYVNQELLYIHYDLKGKNSMTLLSNNATLYAENKLITIAKGYDNVKDRTMNCLGNITINFLDQKTLQLSKGPFGYFDNVVLQASIESRDCGFFIETSELNTQWPLEKSEVIIYIITSCLISLLNIAGVLAMKNGFRKQSKVFATSIETLWFNISFNYCLLILNLILMLSYSSIISIAFSLNSLLTFVFEKNLLVKYYKVKFKRNTNELTEENCKYCCEYVGLASMLFIIQLVLLLMYRFWILYIAALVLVPQIIHNIRRNRPYRYDFSLVFLTVAPKIFFVAYIKLYSGNIFKIAPDHTFFLIYTGLIIIQAIILATQTKTMKLILGFFKKEKVGHLIQDDELCPICMGHLSFNVSYEVSPTLPRRSTIETSCTHTFHKQCLQKWVKAKTECPMCRKNIEDVLEDLEASEDEREPNSGVQLPRLVL